MVHQLTEVFGTNRPAHVDTRLLEQDPGTWTDEAVNAWMLEAPAAIAGHNSRN